MEVRVRFGPPPGLTTYATNTIERPHRTVKHLIPSGHDTRDIASLAVDVCNSLETKIETGHYSKLVVAIAKPLPILYKWILRPNNAHGEELALGEPEDPAKISKRQDLEHLLAHYRAHGPEGTYLFKRVARALGDGTFSTCVYVMPKYSLDYAISKPANMLSALASAVAEHPREVELACANRDTGGYDLFRHMYLRRTFVLVYGREDGTVVDGHKHFMEHGGHSEHQLFAQQLLTKDKEATAPVPKGPATQRKRKARVVQMKWSEALKAMMKPPPLAEVPPSSQSPKEGASGLVVPESDDPVAKRAKVGSLVLGDARCIANTAAGKRCGRKRDAGLFFQQHSAISISTRARSAEFAMVGKWLKSAERLWRLPMKEDGDLQKALQAFLGDSEKTKKAR